jgi:hypothetical protein
METFQKAVMNICLPDTKSTRPNNFFKVQRNNNASRENDQEIKKLKEICDECYYNWDKNDGVIRSKNKARKAGYDLIRYLERREISIPRTF